MGLLQIALTILIVLLLIRPAGRYLVRAYDPEPGRLNLIFGPVERLLYRMIGVRAGEVMSWKQYLRALLLSNGAMFLLLYVLLRVQGGLPLNPDQIGDMSPVQAFNTAASYVTKTTWQSFAGENALSYLSQMAAMTFLIFGASASGLAVTVAFIRALTGQQDHLGNFYEDLVRTIVWVYLPVAAAVALILVWQGVPQTLQGAAAAGTYEGEVQMITRGPVATLEAIKHVATNGGSYFGANSAHPFANPTPLTNLVLIMSMMLLPTALLYAFGRWVGNARQGWMLLSVCLLPFLALLGMIWSAEQTGTPPLTALGVHGNLEGKEVRFGIAESTLFTAVTTAASNGSVNNMHDSLTPLGGMGPLVLLMLNNVFGCVGVGLLNLLSVVLLTLFVCGLMVGRTPVFLGKKIERREVALVCLTVLTSPLLILLPTAAANNGSSFGGLNANTDYYNLTIGLVMLIGRYLPLLAMGACHETDHDGHAPYASDRYAVVCRGVAGLQPDCGRADLFAAAHARAAGRAL